MPMTLEGDVKGAKGVIYIQNFLILEDIFICSVSIIHDIYLNFDLLINLSF